jgi:HPt (histidine-containing phosphotransfer) domain-containing protein
MSLFDRNVTLERLGGDLELLTEVAQIYTGSARAQLDAIESALAAGDIDRVYRETHSLKGSTSVFEAPAAVAAILELESAAKAGDVARSAPLVARVNELVTALVAHLETPGVLESVGG